MSVLSPSFNEVKINVQTLLIRVTSQAKDNKSNVKRFETRGAVNSGMVQVRALTSVLHSSTVTSI